MRTQLSGLGDSRDAQTEKLDLPGHMPDEIMELQRFRRHFAQTEVTFEEMDSRHCGGAAQRQRMPRTRHLAA